MSKFPAVGLGGWPDLNIFFFFRAGSDCDVVTPLSTAAGKGSWGAWEGVEAVYGLSGAAKAFAGSPLNYAAVQAALDGCQMTEAELIVDSWRLHGIGFSGKPHYDILALLPDRLCLLSDTH